MSPPTRRFGRPPPWPGELEPCRWHARAYERFFQPGVAPARREKIGLEALLAEHFPVRSHDGAKSLSYLGYELGDPPLPLEECRRRRRSYAHPLHLRLRLDGPEPVEELVEVGAVPALLGNGSFLINGVERVVVAQLQRAAGIDFFADRVAPPLHACRIQPQRGAPVQLRVTRRGTLEARLAEGTRVPAFTLLRALSPDLSGDLAILRRLADVRTLTIDPGGPALPATLAEDIIDPQTGELYGEAGEPLTPAGCERLAGKAREVSVLAGSPDPVLVASLRERQPRSHEAALLELYRRLRRGHPPSLDRARQLLHDRFRDPLRYQLGPVGRFRLNRRLGLEGGGMELTADDLLAALRELLALLAGRGRLDDADHLANRRVRLLDELLLDDLRRGLLRFRRVVQDRLQKGAAGRPRDLARHGAIAAALEAFFARHELSQPLDQANPLAQLAHERRLSALGPGGLDRKRARLDARDVHPSHWGRLCPVETPEGAAIGLVSHLALHAEVDDLGFLLAPHLEVTAGAFGREVRWLRADEEEGRVVAPADVPHDGARLTEASVVARRQGDFEPVPAGEVEYVALTPAQAVGVSAGLIPFLEHDDANRALMGSNMQRQAVPLLAPEAPLVGTGLEARAGAQTSLAVRAAAGGVVRRVDARGIRIDDRDYPLTKFLPLPVGTCLNQKPIVREGDRVRAGQVIADGPGMRGGELALGRNVLVAFLPWEGYNFEDAIVISERLARGFTSLHFEEFEADRRDNRLGKEEFTRDVPGAPPRALLHLDDEGLVRVGSRVRPGDVLVGKVVPRSRPETTPQQRLLAALLGRPVDRANDSLVTPPGVEGVVAEVRRFRRGDEGLEPGVLERVRVVLAGARPVVVGDKMAGRHGNKGVISKILPVEDMPYMADGTPVDILLNPLGVPSRMNVGQILETHLGWAAARLGFKAVTPVFDGAAEPEIRAALKEAGLPETGKCVLYDGRTGERFEQPVTVGYIYMLKLHHLVDDKVHARATGPYSLITQQPLGGKARFGGQRLGEMEVWALEAYGAASLLQEMLTLKSDDVEGRARLYEALLEGGDLPAPGTPASFEVLRQELRGLGIDLRVERDE